LAYTSSCLRNTPLTSLSEAQRLQCVCGATELLKAPPGGGRLMRMPRPQHLEDGTPQSSPRRRPAYANAAATTSGGWQASGPSPMRHNTEQRPDRRTHRGALSGERSTIASFCATGSHEVVGRIITMPSESSLGFDRGIRCVPYATLPRGSMWTSTRAPLSGRHSKHARKQNTRNKRLHWKPIW